MYHFQYEEHSHPALKEQDASLMLEHLQPPQARLGMHNWFLSKSYVLRQALLFSIIHMYRPSYGIHLVFLYSCFLHSVLIVQSIAIAVKIKSNVR